MKKKIFISLIFFLTLGLSGCSSENKEIEYLKKQNDALKTQLEKMTVQTGKIDLKISGRLTLQLYNIGKDYELGDEDYRTLTVSLFQSAPFLLRVHKTIASQLKVDKIYTFQFKEDTTIYNIDYFAYSSGYIFDEWFIKQCAEDIVLVGEAKESETGLESNKMKIEVVDNKDK